MTNFRALKRLDDVRSDIIELFEDFQERAVDLLDDHRMGWDADKWVYIDAIVLLVLTPEPQPFEVIRDRLKGYMDEMDLREVLVRLRDTRRIDYYSEIDVDGKQFASYCLPKENE